MPSSDAETGMGLRQAVVAFFESGTAAARAAQVVNLADASDDEGRRAWLTLSNMPTMVCAHLEHARAWDATIARHYAKAPEETLVPIGRRVAAVLSLERAATRLPHLLVDLLRFDTCYLYLPAVWLWVHALKDPDFLHARGLMAPKPANDILKGIAATISRGKAGREPKLPPMANVTAWHDLVAEAVHEHVARRAPDAVGATAEPRAEPLDELAMLMSFRRDEGERDGLTLVGLRQMVDYGGVADHPGRLEALVVGILAAHFKVDDETIKSRLKLEARQRRASRMPAGTAIEDAAGTRNWKIVDAWANAQSAPTSSSGAQPPPPQPKK